MKISCSVVPIIGLSTSATQSPMFGFAVLVTRVSDSVSSYSLVLSEWKLQYMHFRVSFQKTSFCFSLWKSNCRFWWAVWALMLVHMVCYIEHVACFSSMKQSICFSFSLGGRARLRHAMCTVSWCGVALWSLSALYAKCCLLKYIPLSY